MAQGKHAYTRAKKKLIVAADLNYDPHKKIWDCRQCTNKRERGCSKERKKPVASFGCRCGGNKNCEICKGVGTFKIYRCPSQYVRDKSIDVLMPLFYHWRNTTYAQWPDGGAVLTQPIMMRHAFDIVLGVSLEKEKKAMERNNGQ